MSKIIVVGGGASGLVAAIYAKKMGHSVKVLERNNKCGKKLLLTGNGRCNYWNSDMGINHFRSTNNEYLSYIFNEKNYDEIMDFFDCIGIVPKIKNGYYYPFSNQSISIQNALLKEIENLQIEICYDTLVKNIKYENKFILETSKGVYVSDKLILSTGSKAYPITGSDGIGYEILKNFNHNIIKVLPALVQVVSDNPYMKLWTGIKSEVNLRLYENNKFIKEEYGEIMLTDYGASGICVFQLSSLISRGLDKNKKEEIYINFLPNIKGNILDYLEERNKKLKNRNIIELLEGIINYKLLIMLAKSSNINDKYNFSDLTKEEKQKFINNLCNYKLNIVDTKDFNSSQVCSGGVDINEININTMESKKIKGLYITGELLDVDGDCGGYNLGFAFISGMLAGKGTIYD